MKARNGADLVFIKATQARRADGRGYKGREEPTATHTRGKAKAAVGFLEMQGGVKQGIAGIARRRPEEVADGVRASKIQIIQCLDVGASLQLMADCNLTMAQLRMLKGVLRHYLGQQVIAPETAMRAEIKTLAVDMQHGKKNMEVGEGDKKRTAERAFIRVTHARAG